MENKKELSSEDLATVSGGNSGTEQKAYFIGEVCLQCGVCVDVCPVEAVSPNESGLGFSINADLCIGCGNCAYECPLGSITMR